MMRFGTWVDGFLVFEPSRDVEETRKSFRHLSIDHTPAQEPSHACLHVRNDVHDQNHAKAPAMESNDPRDVDDGYMSDVSEVFTVDTRHSDGYLLDGSSSKHSAIFSSTEHTSTERFSMPVEFKDTSFALLDTETPLNDLGWSDSEPTTDSVESEQSPCQRKLSRNSKAAKQPVKSSSVTNDEYSIANLYRIERRPNHLWTSKQQIVLCLLYRFYEGPGAEYTIPAVFNQVTSLNIRRYNVQKRFADLCYFGPEAYLDLKMVFDTPYHSDGNFSSFFKSIELAIKNLDVNLRRRKHEMTFDLGRAKSAKSPRTRRRFKELKRKASQQAKFGAVSQQRTRKELPALAAATASDDVMRMVQDVKLKYVPFPDIANLLNSQERLPALAFRVWDAHSGGKYVPSKGILSEGVRRWNGAVLNPPSPYHNGETLLYEWRYHLDKKGGRSRWVSVSTSLLHVLNLATEQDNPRIAAIDMQHPSFLQPYKTYDATQVIAWLRANHVAPRRYRGTTEVIIYSDVCEEAILHQFAFRDLWALADESPACQRIMNLQLLKKGRRTGRVSSMMEDKKTVLDLTAAKSMALIAKLFGMHGTSLAVLQAFVAQLINAFHLNPGDDMCKNVLAAAFAQELDSHVSTREDVMISFTNGVIAGRSSIAVYSKRGR